MVVMYSSSSSSGNFPTSLNSTDRQERNASALVKRVGGSGGGESTLSTLSSPSRGLSSSNRSSSSSAVVTTPSAFLTLGGLGSASSASSSSISSSAYLPSAVDNIEQTFIDFSSVPVSQASTGSQHPHAQSGFVPPIIDPIPHEQTYPRDLRVHRAGGGATLESVGVSKQASSLNASRSGLGNNNNNNNNNNIVRSSVNNVRNNVRSTPNINVNHNNNNVSGNDGNMVANNSSLSLQDQLGNWHPHLQSVANIGGGNNNNNNNNNNAPASIPHHHHHQQHPQSATTTPSKQGGPRRHTGPRAPKNETNLSPEEAERRRIRRERNKLAAAKCRKRRMDHTAQLQDETEELESVQREIHNEIMSLQQQKEQLEFILQAHKVQCKRGIPITNMPSVYIPPLTLADDAHMKDELTSNLSNDSLSSTTSTYSPAPPSMQQQQQLSSSRPATTSMVVTAPHSTANNPSSSSNAAAAHRPTSLPIIVKQETPFKLEPPLQQPPQEGGDVKPEAMDVNVTQATGISISTPKVSPRVLSFFDVMGDHTGLTPITGGGVIAAAGSNTGTPISNASGGGNGNHVSMVAGYANAATPTTKMGTPTDRGTSEKPNSQHHTLMSL